ncbi:MAG: hypothetical protein P1U46_01460 [Patescibacteria group bacterium]|nr:hypothetical protein [Patescibacteria group bacterium]
MKLDLEDGLSSDISDENNKLFILYKDEFVSKISNYNLKESLDVTFKFLDYLNNYVTTTEPWALMKDESKNEEVKEILYSICE